MRPLMLFLLFLSVAAISCSNSSVEPNNPGGDEPPSPQDFWPPFSLGVTLDFDWDGEHLSLTVKASNLLPERSGLPPTLAFRDTTSNGRFWVLFSLPLSSSIPTGFEPLTIYRLPLLDESLCSDRPDGGTKWGGRIGPWLSEWVTESESYRWQAMGDITSGASCVDGSNRVWSIQTEFPNPPPEGDPWSITLNP